MHRGAQVCIREIESPAARPEGSFLDCLSAAMVEAFRCLPSRVFWCCRQTVDTTISMVGLNWVIIWNKRAWQQNRLAVSSAPLIDTHVSSTPTVGPKPRSHPSTQGYQVHHRAGFDKFVARQRWCMGWGAQATARKLFPAADILGVSEMGSQAAYTAASSSLFCSQQP
jgi:hypothetical protein